MFKSVVSLIYISLNFRTLKTEKVGGSVDCSKRHLKETQTHDDEGELTQGS